MAAEEIYKQFKTIVQHIPAVGKKTTEWIIMDPLVLFEVVWYLIHLSINNSIRKEVV